MTMRIVGIAVGCLIGLSSAAMAETKTVVGEIVDQACFTKDKTNRGADHKDCGLSCAKKGAPLAIVTTGGDVYTIAGAYTENKNAKLIDVFATMVEATGEVSTKDGNKVLTVTTLKKAS